MHKDSFHKLEDKLNKVFYVATTVQCAAPFIYFFIVRFLMKDKISLYNNYGWCTTFIGIYAFTLVVY